MASGANRIFFPFPVGLLELLLRAGSREDVYERLTGSLVADPSALLGLGWAPRLTTPAGLATLMSSSFDRTGF